MTAWATVACMGLIAFFGAAGAGAVRAASGTGEDQGQVVFENRTGYPVDLMEYDDEAGTYSHFEHLPDGGRLVETVGPGLTFFFRVNYEAFIGQYTTTNAPDQSLVLDASTLAGVGYPLPETRAKSATGEAGSAMPAPLPEVEFDAPSEEIAARADLPPKAELSVEEAPPEQLRPWYEGPEEAFAITAQGAKFVDIPDGKRFTMVTSTPEKIAQTSAAWFSRAVAGTSTHHLRNVHHLDGYLFIDPQAQDGSEPRFGAEGAALPTARWRLQKTPTGFTEIFNDARPDLRLAMRNDRLILSRANYDNLDPNVRDIKAFSEGGMWLLFDVAGYRSLLSMTVEMAKNIEEYETQRTKRLAEIERVKQEAVAAEARRREIARKPEVISGGKGHEQVSIRLGVGDVVTTESGAKVIEYKFSPQDAYLRTELQTGDQQAMELTLEPKVTAYVHEGRLYVRLQTPKNTRIDMRHGKKPSTDLPTDGNFYLAHVRMNAQFDYGREIHQYPVPENERTDAGVSSDSSEGVNFSFEEIVGADLSVTKGNNANFGAMDFRVSGQRGPADDPFFGSTQYDWHGCGLAVTVKTTKNCTYDAPTDMYDPATQSLREIKTIAHAMPGLETDTIFRVDYPSKQGLPDRLMLPIVVSTQLHMAKIVRSTKENTKNKDWEDFVAGLTYVFRPDKWDINKSFEDQEIIRDSLYKPVGFTLDKAFKYYMFVHVEDLKAYMD